MDQNLFCRETKRFPALPTRFIEALNENLKFPQVLLIIRIDPDRLRDVFEELAGLLVAAQLLVTLALQVPLQDLLHQEFVCPFGPQEHILIPQSLKHWTQTHETQCDTVNAVLDLMTNYHLYTGSTITPQ